MISKRKEIPRREFLTKSTKNAAGVLALSNLVSCTTSEEVSVAQHPENWGLVTRYELDSAWPQKPDEFTWNSVPGVAVDAHDRVWIINRATPAVQVYDADGKFITAWGKIGLEAYPTSTEPTDFSFPTLSPEVHQIKIDYEGNVWIAERELHVVYKCSPDGKLLLTLGTLNESGNDETHLNGPSDMAITPNGEVFVSDGYGNFRIVHFDAKGKFIKAWGKQGTGPGEFDCLHAISIDPNGLIYISDRGNTRIQIFDQNCKFIDQWPNIIVPFDHTISNDGDIWACGYGPLRNNITSSLPRTEDQLVLKFNSQGKLLLLWTLPTGHNPGEFDEVHGIALDSKGNVYLGDVRGNRIQKYVLQEQT